MLTTTKREVALSCTRSSDFTTLTLQKSEERNQVASTKPERQTDCYLSSLSRVTIPNSAKLDGAKLDALWALIFHLWLQQLAMQVALRENNMGCNGSVLLSRDRDK